MASFRPSGYRGKLLTRLDEGGAESTFDTTPATAPDGSSLTTVKIGDFVVITVNPGADNEEKISASAVSTSGTTATWTIVNRGLSFTENAAVTANKKQHAIGETVIISNDDHFVNEQIVDIDTAQTISGMKTVSTPTAAGHIATKQYVDDNVNGGAVSFDQLIEEGEAGETVAAGELVYYDDTDNEWKLCDADTATTVDNVMLGIAQGAGTDGNTISGGVLRRGIDKTNTGLTQGQKYFASNTAGALATSAGTTERAVGYGDANGNLVFDPYFESVVTADEKDALAGGGDFGTPSSSNKFITQDYNSSATGLPVVNVYTSTSTILGESSTQFDITNTSGDTYRYTYDSTGSDPGITSSNPSTGDYVYINGKNFNSANNGMFQVTASDTDYFEITNASGVAENNVTLGSGGSISLAATWTKPAGLKYIEVEVQGGGGPGADSNANSDYPSGGGAGGYSKKLIPASSLSDTEPYVVGEGGTSELDGAVSAFGTFLSAQGGEGGDNGVPGKGGTSTGGDINIPGGDGHPSPVRRDDGANTSAIGGNGGASFFGGGGHGADDNTNRTGEDGQALGSGGGGAAGYDSNASGGDGADGAVIVTEHYI